ncbi:MAG: TIGR03905 family TSCPD domain-containing protein [Ruminococcaceae bacterium]|nr:TIGR03905 family TSCPD domain-containing protein [Oscillospiraceae bacterium]
MMKYTYNTKGTCSQVIEFEIGDDGIITDVSFKGGCNGNLKAISKLVNGKNAKEIADTLRGNTCGPRSTSCADQLARAIDEALAG